MRIITFALILGTGLAAQSDETSYLFRIPGALTAGQQLLIARQFDPLECGQCTVGKRGVRVVVLPDQRNFFLQGFPQARLLERGRPFHEIRNEWLASWPGDAPPDPNYYTVAEIEQEIDAVAAAYPAIAMKIDLTTLPGGQKTWGNRSIFALKISDNVGQTEDEPAFVFAAQHHARELNGPHMVIGAMQRIASGYGVDPALTALVNGKELYFVPMANPDGVDYVWNFDNFWRKNRRNNGNGTFGVDLNRNFPFLWGVCGSSSFTGSNIYKGPSAGSEPETKSLRALIAAVRPEVYIDFHSFGQEVLTLYPPCATVSTAIGNLDVHYRNDLRNPMFYAWRSPSASGEAPHDHWGSGGALSYLVEIGTSFQPAFSATVTEEARVWPGLRHALTTWKPAVRGNVTSVFQGQPLEATVSYTPSSFFEGEQIRSRARDGRYSAFLPLGTWTLTVAAVGYQPQTRTVTVNNYDQGLELDVELEPVWPQATIARSGTGQIGSVVTTTYTSPGDAGAVYFIGASLGIASGTAVGTRVFPLDNDFLLQASLLGNPLMMNNWGNLNGADQGVALMSIPNNPQLVGLDVYFAGATLVPGYTLGVKKFSPAIKVTIQP